MGLAQTEGVMEWNEGPEGKNLVELPCSRSETSPR